MGGDRRRGLTSHLKVTRTAQGNFGETSLKEKAAASKRAPSPCISGHTLSDVDCSAERCLGCLGFYAVSTHPAQKRVKNRRSGASSPRASAA